MVIIAKSTCVIIISRLPEFVSQILMPGLLLYLLVYILFITTARVYLGTQSNLFEKCILGSGVSMVHLDQQDLQRLIGILQQFSEFEDEKSRRSFLPLVGLGLLLPRMDLAGPPFIASMKIVNFLGAYGRLPN